MKRETLTLGETIPLPKGVAPSDVSDGYHTFGELYDHRILAFMAAMKLAHNAAMDCGWSKKHDDGELCFGGGWVVAWITAPSGLQARYHMEETRPLPLSLERPLGSPWNGKEETLEALAEIASA